MKVIEKFEIEYVVPETEKERLEIQAIIDDFDNNKNRKIDYSKLSRPDKNLDLKGGYWRK